MTACAVCHSTPPQLKGRGLCGACYGRIKRAGNLADFVTLGSGVCAGAP